MLLKSYAARLSLRAMSDVTRILLALERGDQKAAADLLPLVYQELRRLARQQMERERTNHTLESTALVHEAYLRLVGSGPVRWDSCGHFFAAASEAMRRILIDHARNKKSLRRGGREYHVSADEEFPLIAIPAGMDDDVLALNDALDRLAEIYPIKASIVKLRYFGGLSMAEAAAALGISRATAGRHWTFAKAWLHDVIARDREGPRVP
jgi:RNA polymerase sigma factor (TIGR02999 family)